MFIWIEGVLSTYHEIYEGSTPFHEAAGQGRLEMCKLIMEYIQDKNPEDNEHFTALHLAAQNGHLETCKLILDNVTNKNPGDNDGFTPLHSAAQNGKTGRAIFCCK